MARYCPASNNHHPFNNDPEPEAFALKDLSGYLDSIPSGLSELTDEGPLAISREAYSWRTDVPRVFIARSEDGESAALLEIDGDALEERLLEYYLARHSAYVTGADVREMGRIGAVVMDIMLRHYHPDEELNNTNLLGWQASLDKGLTLNITLQPAGVPILDRVRRLQYRPTIPTHSEMLKAASDYLGDWPVWERMAREFPREVASGQIPQGIACYRPKDGVSLQNGGMWVPAYRASLSFSRNDIVCVTTPQSHAVLMCLDTQHGVANCEPGEEHLQPALQWLGNELTPTLIKEHGHNPYGLLYGHLAAKLINDNLGARGRRSWGGTAGISQDYPRITRSDGSFYPMVIDAVFVPAEAKVQDIIDGAIFTAQTPAV